MEPEDSLYGWLKIMGAVMVPEISLIYLPT
jgi:hypothetical protein